ncbi:hypothetical protein BDP27DRAFT_275980 [Rhodocollybia butyracea]|uniref:Uncharacterized protein n=1 Tax=Rhodocollybia butyracea TaxID=206335 RepID=A0A9P5PCR6_9AGAR|nr:hypothetical protein BDP27DRAFT_275980 [Rhodocollybia butyracea]
MAARNFRQSWFESKQQCGRDLVHRSRLCVSLPRVSNHVFLSSFISRSQDLMARVHIASRRYPGLGSSESVEFGSGRKACPSYSYILFRIHRHLEFPVTHLARYTDFVNTSSTTKPTVSPKKKRARIPTGSPGATSLPLIPLDSSRLSKSTAGRRRALPDGEGSGVAEWYWKYK